MTILMDHEIRSLCSNRGTLMIKPFIDKPVREKNGEKILSYGLSSAGYDVRIGDPPQPHSLSQFIFTSHVPYPYRC